MIRNRLQALEDRNRNMDLPELVMIYWDDEKNRWIAKEQYVKKSLKGKILPNTGKVKLIVLADPEDYRPPEGFRGKILIEGELE
jgi:hypothetical protein